MSITRRDFVNGIAWAAGEPIVAAAQDAAGAAPAAPGGLRGQTDAAAAAAHALRDDPRRWRGAPAELDEGIEDLVVVGAGISGLAGAVLYQRHAGAGKRMLLIDPLAQPGGHAWHNEFVSRSGRRLVGYGGSQSLDTPSFFSPAVKALLSDIGIETARFESGFYDRGWLQRHGVAKRGVFFGREAWGEDRLIVAERDEPADAWLLQAPMSAAARNDLAQLLAGVKREHALYRLAPEALRARLAAMTYARFLAEVWRADPPVLSYFQWRTAAYFGVGIDATSALDAYAAGLPGFGGLKLPTVDARMSPSGRLLATGPDDYIYHFPDGNAGLARALLRALRPEWVPGSGMETLSSAALRDDRFDEPAAAVRLRLRSTVVGLRHLGPPGQAELVELRYVDAAGRLRAVRARQVLLACWHRVVARLTDELSAPQRRALDDQVKVPLLQATVLLSDWKAWARAGIASFGTPGGFWQDLGLDYPVNLGELHASASPDEPVLMYLGRVCVPGNGADPRTQSRLGRAELLGWSFEFLEGSIRDLLRRALGGHGFDERTIEAITVNRWSHGYAYEYMRPWDRFWPQGPLPCETARRGWGRVAIANSDSGAYAYAHGAIDQAARAVQELLPQALLPAWSRFPGPEPKAILRA